MEEATDGLRKAAPDWSLNGDKQLLDLLQNMHQRIIEKCQETNKKLENMVSSLDDASINLQNVNNKFTALSNSQFIESRVYDDDFSDSGIPEASKDQPAPLQLSELDSIKESLYVLERMHETVTILCDSDSDSGSDEEDDGSRLIVKPKDLYASRPLPYIIGSKQWKSKWHAGLIREESDSEIEDGDAGANPAREQYSDSEGEGGRHSPTISSGSLDSRNPNSDIVFNSDTRYPAPAPAQPKTQADIAAELARRLGAAPAKAPVFEPEDTKPEPVVRKMYTPHQPAPGAIFSDEPPPLENEQSEESDHDIFAEIYKTSSYSHGDKDRISVADDLFGKPIFDDQIPTSNLFEKPHNKEVLISNENTATKNCVAERKSVENDDGSAKKPVGGKSIFGSNANSESIGAAILKRKSRRSSTSGSDSDQEPPPITTHIKTAVTKTNDDISTKINNESQSQKQNAIFDELFAKSERVNKELDKKLNKKPVTDTVTKAKTEKKVDLFSDNIFDNIDDIFTTKVTINTKERRDKEKAPLKSIFDDDEDDLFSDLAANKTSNKDISKIGKESEKSEDLETEDDLFSKKQKETIVTEVNKTVTNIIKESKGIFDDSDDELFSDFNKPKNTDTEALKTRPDDLFSDDDNLFTNKTAEIKKVTPKLIINESESINTSDMKTKKFVQSPDLFEDDISDTMSPKSASKIDRNLSNTIHKSNAPMPVNIKKQDIIVNPAQEDTKTDKSAELLKREFIKSKIDAERILLDDDSKENLFGKPLKVRSDISKNELRESHITKDKGDEILGEKENIASHEVAANSDVNTKITISKEALNESSSGDDLNTTVINTQVIISENITGNTTVPKPEMTLKPKVQVINIHTEVSQIQSLDTSRDSISESTKQTKIQEDRSPNVFSDEAESPFPSLSENMTESETDTRKDIFTDIFNDQPPEFEKPKEPKRSKNVNALFDDDSDDESLFFKKNDVIPDERPEGFTTSDDRLFGLFRDEPPAIDVDFVQKSNKKDHIDITAKRPDNIKSTIFDDDDTDISPAISEFDKLSQIDDIFSKSDDFENSFESDSNNQIIGAKENFKTNEIKNICETDIVKSKTQDTTDSPQLESKKVGKLKPMNFNINVNTLLPGASPKKSAVKEVKDNAVVKTVDKNNEQLLTKEVDIPDNTATMVKSVSFEGEPDSAVLDNKLSKERAKIQVKRRPSTRRARRDAVKKSGIDFGEDTTDNATSATTTDSKDEILHDTGRQEQIAHNVEVKKGTATLTTENKEDEYRDEDIKKRDSKIHTNKQDKVTPDNKTVYCAPDFISPDTDVAKNIGESIPDFKTKSTQGNETKSKVVYILNDDDIFNTSTIKKDPNNPKQSIFDEAGTFKTIRVSKDSESIESADTKIPDKPKQKAELFANSDSDDDLFKRISKPATKIQAETIKTTKADTIEDLFKSASNPVSNQTTEGSSIKTKTTENNDREDLFERVSKPVTDAAKPVKNILYDSEDDTAKIIAETTRIIVDSLKNKSKATIKEQKTSTTTILGDDDEILFKNIPKSSQKSEDPKPDIKQKTSIFDSDENLFKNSNKNVDKVTKPPLFSSDSDEELFSGKKKEIKHPKKEAVFEKKIEVKKVDKKKSLFGDESDDDDLFKTKKKSVEPQTRTSATREVPTKDTSMKSEAVSEDPLSLFGGDGY